MSAGAAGAAAGAAAAAAAEQARKEEEEMTPYTPRDLNENWEFKILRCVTRRFRDPIWLNGILQEEARAGWMIVEKFDDSRVRLKRPAGARANDATLDFDPYRTWVGMSQWRYTGLILAAVIAIIAGIATAAATFALLMDAGHR
jgi:hypothetical protein